MKNCASGDVRSVKFKINEGLDSPTSEAEREDEEGGFSRAIEGKGSNCSELKKNEISK